MAKVMITLTVETAEWNDALRLLAEIHARLAKRHGDAFRRLEREIEMFADAPNEDCVGVHPLSADTLIAAPAGQFTEIFRQARLLGVID